MVTLIPGSVEQRGHVFRTSHGDPPFCRYPHPYRRVATLPPCNYITSHCTACIDCVALLQTWFAQCKASAAMYLIPVLVILCPSVKAMDDYVVTKINPVCAIQCECAEEQHQCVFLHAGH